MDNFVLSQFLNLSRICCVIVIPPLYCYRSLGYRDDAEKKPSHMEMVPVQASAGMMAGACTSIITTPIDTVKTRLQVIWHIQPFFSLSTVFNNN